MRLPMRRCGRAPSAGFTLIEVLVTLLILLLGLLGLVGLQSRAQVAENESYQRAQALVLLRDMADRINANRTNASSYAFAVTAPLGTASTKSCSAPSTMADVDLCQWDASLKGAAETAGGTQVGAMLNARGCVTSPAANTFLIQVVWQGLAQTGAPPSASNCGSGQYGDETQRRAVTTTIVIGTLT